MTSAAAQAGGGVGAVSGMAEGSSPLVSILIVAYNSAGYIADCIGSVIAHTEPGSYEILLIDNGTDGTEVLVQTTFPQVRIIPSRGNIGFGQGNNLLAQNAHGQFLLLLNPDTKLVNPAIDQLLAFAMAQPGGAWGGVTTYPDGKLDGGNFLNIPTIGGILREAVGIQVDSDRHRELESLRVPKPVSVLCGGFMMVSRQAWDAVDGFDPSFLLYAEEIDLFTRLRAQRIAVWLTPKSRIVHDVGSGAIYSANRTRYKFTGLMHYAWRHWPAPGAVIVGTAYWFAAFRRWLVSMALGPVSQHHRARHQAYHAIVFRPGLWWYGYRGRASLE